MQIQEVRNEGEFRRMAMDSLARELCANLPNGWQRPLKRHALNPQTIWKNLAAIQSRTLTEEEKSQRIEFQMSGAYAYWVVLLQKYDPNIDARADAVWKALSSLSPSTGWIPKGPDDPLIVLAFDVGWPAPPKRKVKRRQYGLLCPKCTAVLSVPSEQASEIVCHLCGEQIELV